MKQLTNEEKEFYLREVEPERFFWVNNGAVLKNMEGLLSIESMDDDTFKHHVNKEKSDFYNWVNEVVGDKKLAKDIAKLKTKATMLKKIKARLASLKK